MYNTQMSMSIQCFSFLTVKEYASKALAVHFIAKMSVLLGVKMSNEPML